MRERVPMVAAVALLLAAIAAFVINSGSREDGADAAPAPGLDEMADAIGAPIMRHLARGHVAGRSGEMMLVPVPHAYIIGRWDLATLGTDRPFLTTSHPNPWAYTARVPIILYGPGHVPSGKKVYREVDIADLAPTFAEILGMTGLDFDGEVLREALAGATRPPKVIFTVVIDGGGWNALHEHPNSWPVIASLQERGTSYLNATIGSAPSITGALHATFGTGVYPTTHGIPGNQMRGEDGENTDAWLQNADPRYLEAPTVSELWDEANGNRPVVGTVSYEGWHLGMIGHGAARAGADKDIAVLWEAEENEWWINEEFYELPDYLEETDLERLESYEEQLDERDGVADGLWLGHDLEEIREDVVRPGSPAFVRFTGDAVVDVMRNERLGADSVTDIFWVEMKMPDFAGHRWNMLGPEEADVIHETDAQIGRFVAELDRTVGRGNYVLALSADHGQQPLPDIYGGWRINSNELEADVERRFGGIVEKVTTVDMFLNMDAVEDRGVDLEEVAEFLGSYTIGDNVPAGQPGADLVPQGRLDDRLFAGAFPTGYLQSLTEETIETFGESDYPEGTLTIEPPGAEEG